MPAKICDPNVASWPPRGMVWLKKARVAPLLSYKVNVAIASEEPGFTIANPVNCRSCDVNDRGKFRVDCAVAKAGHRTIAVSQASFFMWASLLPGRKPKSGAVRVFEQFECRDRHA